MNSREQFDKFVEEKGLARCVSGKSDEDRGLVAFWLFWQASRACATPEWEHAPDWANWLAMDVEGRWYWFAEKPEQRSATWANGWATRVSEAGLTPGRSGWAETLEPRP